MGERLDSWKEIAAYLGRDVRTVQRWALGRGLPVHHLPGGGSKPRVFASAAELEGWVGAGGRVGHDRRGGQASVAVLPFASLAGASARHFADGLADDLINELVRIPGLRVTARTSSFAFRGAEQDVREIGARLGVGWLVEGSVRRSGRVVRVSAQLVSTRDGFHAWSDGYDRELTDVFAIQADIARSIALALQVTLAPADPPRRPTEDPVAYESWLKGRTISRDYTPAAVAEARKCYDEALARDPLFARPWFGLAELLFQSVQFGLASPEDVRVARFALARALELDDLSGEAHALSGVMLGALDYAWPAAEAAFQRALELSPGSAGILLQHAWFHLVPRRRLAEAVEEAERAVSLDPLSPQVMGRFGLVLVAAGQYAGAVKACRAAVRLAPRLWWLRWFYATALVAGGRVPQAIREAEHVCAQHPRQPVLLGSMALLCGRFFGMRARAARLLAELEGMAAAGAPVPAVARAYACLGAGDARAFEWLGRAVDAGDPTVTLLPSMPMYDGLRGDPRFKALLARMNLA